MLRVENKTKTSKTAKTRDGFVAGKWMLSQQYTLLCSDSCKSIERRFYRWKVNVVTTTLPPVFGQMQKQRERRFCRWKAVVVMTALPPVLGQLQKIQLSLRCVLCSRKSVFASANVDFAATKLCSWNCRVVASITSNSSEPFTSFFRLSELPHFYEWWCQSSRAEWPYYFFFFICRKNHSKFCTTVRDDVYKDDEV